MRNRGADPVDAARGSLSGDKRRLIADFFNNSVRKSDKLFWQALGVTRRHAATPQLLTAIQEMSERDKSRMFRLAHKWLTPPEYRFFGQGLKKLQGQTMGFVSLRIPFGKVRSVAAVTMRLLSGVL